MWSFVKRRAKAAVKWAIFGFIFYKFNWVFTVGYLSFKLVSYITPKLLFYTGAAILSIT